MDFEYPEGATPLDPDEKEGLLLQHITTRAELNMWEQRNIAAAYDWLVRTRSQEILSEMFIRTLHEKMFSKVWEWAGEFRKSNKNIGIDWPRIPVALRQMLTDVDYWIEHATFKPDEIAARFHHRLVFIHLFPNGNGRHARLMADYLLEKQFKRKPFTWGSGDLIDDGAVRSQYICALRAADKNDYQPLLEFVRS